MKAIIGKKVGMSQIFDENGKVIPVTVIDSTDTGAMAQAVTAARRYAGPGDVVLLAPGCASLDMFNGYDARGLAFSRAAQAITGADQEG